MVCKFQLNKTVNKKQRFSNSIYVAPVRCHQNLRIRKSHLPKPQNKKMNQIQQMSSAIDYTILRDGL